MTDPTDTAAPAGYRQDAQGRLVPVEAIRPEDLLEDELVRDIHAKAVALSEQMAIAKAAWFDAVDAYLQLLAEKYDARRGGQRGNLSLATYDGALRVQVAIGDQLTFGPQLQVAKELIDQCLQSWSKDSNANIRTLILDAFDVGKEGKLRIDRILGLRKLAIDDPTWQRAMEAIADALRVERTTRYVRVYGRPGPGRAHEAIALDMAKV